MREKPPDTVEEHAIIEQVEKICKSPEFKSKQLLCEFLSYIVSEYLAGRGDLIKGYSIGVDVFGRGEDFDPGEDALVRIHAGRLRRMLDLYYLKEGSNDPVHIEIPKGGYSPVISEMTHTPSSNDVETDQKLNLKSRLHPSVAVLPFKNLTGDPAKDYFAIGFSEELSVELTKFEDLTIYSCSACKEANEDNTRLKQNYLKKGIRFVLEGSVMQASKQVRVLVKLVDLDHETQLWADSYTKVMTADNLNEIQEVISKQIAQVVGSEYGVVFQSLSLDANRMKPQILDTHTAILKFYYFQANMTPEASGEAFGALQQALIKEPGSAVAKAMLASMHGNRYSLDLRDADNSYRELGRLAEEAFNMDPNSPTVIASLVFKYFIYNEKQRFFNLVNHYLSNFRNNTFKLANIAFHLSLYGDWERGKELLDQTFQTFHGLPVYLYGATCLYHYRTHNYEEALTQANLYDMPSLFWGPMLRAATLGQLNKRKEAKANVEHLINLKPDFDAKAAYLISQYVKEPALVTQVMDGLCKAGMKL